MDTIVLNVLGAVRPDDVDREDDHPWSWLAALATARGLQVSAEVLQVLPYDVILADSVTELLANP